MNPSELRVLGFDIGGTKTAWGVVNQEGTLLEHGRFPTEQGRTVFLEKLCEVINAQKPAAVGLGFPGTVAVNHKDTLVCPHIPELSNMELGTILEDLTKVSVTIDNDGRCALIAEVWLGAAKETTSAVMITLGTGVGGAVMQRTVVLPHPLDLSQEISRLLADPDDLFPSSTGRGTVEALVGGKALEKRFGISMAELAARVRQDDAEAKELFSIISGYFITAVRAIYMTYSCKMIIVGGKGGNDLGYYLQDTPPCPVVPAALGEKAGIFGAARLALDAYARGVDQKKEWD